MTMHHAIKPLAAILLTHTAASAETPPLVDDWERSNDWGIGGVLFPNLHLHGIGGFSSGDPANLATGGHDPARKPFSAQAIEPGLSVVTDHFEAFGNHIIYQDPDGGWDGELEELFGKITNLPGGFEIKGGQYLARFGAVNDKHIHAWDFADAELPVTRFLGDEGLMMRGGELSWTLPLRFDPGLTAVATLGFGKARSHGHGHGHDHGHDDDHDEDHDDDHDDDHDEDHDDDDSHGGALFAGEEGNLADEILTARLAARYRFSDFHTLTAGVSYAGGDNDFGRNTRIMGLDAEYQWRENGLEPGGRAFRWRNELIWRSVSAFEDDEDHGPVSGNYREFGFYTTGTYTWNNRLDTSLRLSWLEGVDDLGLDERLRVSPAVSWWLDGKRRLGLRTQYNYDRFAGGPEEHSLWFQVNIALGSYVEVR
jgi:hypothetical protein